MSCLLMILITLIITTVTKAAAAKKLSYLPTEAFTALGKPFFLRAL